MDKTNDAQCSHLDHLLHGRGPVALLRARRELQGWGAGGLLRGVGWSMRRWGTLRRGIGVPRGHREDRKTGDVGGKTREKVIGGVEGRPEAGAQEAAPGLISSGRHV